jgi:microcystin-dependent protein
MVPYSITPFYPTPSIMLNFGPTGAGTGDWEKIYLCNGLNGTPDLRGRVLVGATSGMAGSAPLPPAVEPGGLNPAYPLGGSAGANGVTLTTGQLPAHTHSASATSTSTGTISPNPHSHSFTYTSRGATSGSNVIGSAAGASTKTTSSQSLSVSITTATTVTNNPTGGNEAHSNVQPGIGVYYIMYIP